MNRPIGLEHAAQRDMSVQTPYGGFVLGFGSERSRRSMALSSASAEGFDKLATLADALAPFATGSSAAGLSAAGVGGLVVSGVA